MNRIRHLRFAQAPNISRCPASISALTDPDKSYATVFWTPPNATDNVGVEGMDHNYRPGDQFPIGVSTVCVPSESGWIFRTQAFPPRV